MKWKLFVAVLTTLLASCSYSVAPTSIPPPPPRAQSTPDLQGDCVRSGGRFVVHTDGSWECAPPVVSQPSASTPRPASVLPPPPASQTYFRLINRHTQRCLAAQVGTQWIVQETCVDNASQQLWKIPSGAVKIDLESKSGRCVAFNNTNNKLVQAGCSGYLPWLLRQFGTYYAPFAEPLKLPHPGIVAPLFTGMYYEISYNDQCVDDDGWSHAEGQVMIHDDCRSSDNDNQLWGMY